MKNRSLLFLGAGATAAVMGTTWGLGEIIYAIVHKPDNLDVRKDLLAPHKQALKSLLRILQKGTSAGEIEAKSMEYATRYGGDKDQITKTLQGLKELYDFDCLKVISEMIGSDGHIDLMLIYTTIDLLIKEQGGLEYNDRFYPLSRVRRARDLLNVITHTVLQCQTAFIFEKKKETIAPYQAFIDALVEITRKESLQIASTGVSYTEPDFVNFGYSLVSFNWEPLMLGLLFKAHRDFNHSPKTPYLGKDCLRLRLFNDFGLTIGSLRKDNAEQHPHVWYQGHESIAIRVNDEEYPSRLMRVGKILYPHGSLAFRMCPVCRKTNFVVRGIDQILNYFGPGILPEFNDYFSQKVQTEKEELSFKKGTFDALECYCCGNIMRMTDTPLVMQTAFKNHYPPILEESLYDLTVQLRQSNHLLFLGFKCAMDDVIYRSKILAALTGDSKKKVSVVLRGRSLQSQKWYSREEVEKQKNSGQLPQRTVDNITNFSHSIPR